LNLKTLLAVASNLHTAEEREPTLCLFFNSIEPSSSSYSHGIIAVKAQNTLVEEEKEGGSFFLSHIDS